MKIAIVKLSAMGDIIHAMIVLQIIKRNIPDVQIDWIVEEVFAAVLEHHPYIDHIYTVNLKSLKKNKLNFFNEVKKLRSYSKNKYDIVVDLQGLIKSAVVSQCLGKSIGFDKHSIRESFAAMFYSKSFFVSYEENVILRNMKLMYKALNIDFDIEHLNNKEKLLFFTKKDTEKIEPYVSKNKKNIIYILGSSWESKVYPKDKFIEIVNGLEGNHLLVWGSEKEYISAQYVSEHSKATCLPQMNLNTLKALIARADLVIGADSGPTHFAWALNRPSITIYGPTPSNRNTYVTDINHVIDCQKQINALKLNKKDFCIQEISSNRIISVAKDLLNA